MQTEGLSFQNFGPFLFGFYICSYVMKILSKARRDIEFNFEHLSTCI